MSTFVLLRIGDDDEARRLVEDMREYPGEPLLTPVQENTVHATVVQRDASRTIEMPWSANGHPAQIFASVSDVRRHVEGLDP